MLFKFVCMIKYYKSYFVTFTLDIQVHKLYKLYYIIYYINYSSV